jgi:hypothetical protein
MDLTFRFEMCDLRGYEADCELLYAQDDSFCYGGLDLFGADLGRGQ